MIIHYINGKIYDIKNYIAEHFNINKIYKIINRLEDYDSNKEIELIIDSNFNFEIIEKNK